MGKVSLIQYGVAGLLFVGGCIALGLYFYYANRAKHLDANAKTLKTGSLVICIISYVSAVGIAAYGYYKQVKTIQAQKLIAHEMIELGKLPKSDEGSVKIMDKCNNLVNMAVDPDIRIQFRQRKDSPAELMNMCNTFARVIEDGTEKYI